MSGVGLAQAGYKEVTEWKKVFPGIWSVRIGNPSLEQSWTALSAEPPRTNALENLPEREFPFNKVPVLSIETDGRIGVRIPHQRGGKLYGMGLQLDGLEMKSEEYVLRVGNGKESQAPVPFFFSTAGYGIFFDIAREVRVRPPVMRQEEKTETEEGGKEEGVSKKYTAVQTVEAEVYGKGMRMFLIAGESPLDIVSRYNLLNGGGALPPLWALGGWAEVPSEAGAEEVLKMAGKIREGGVPLDVLNLDTGWMTAGRPSSYEWKKEAYPEVKEFITTLLEKKVRVNLSLTPFISSSSPLYEELQTFSGSHLMHQGLIADLYLPEAVEILMKQHAEKHVYLNASGYRVMMGEERFWPDHAVFPSGVPAETMRQTLSTVSQKTYYNELFKPRNQRTYALVSELGGASSSYPAVVLSEAETTLEALRGISSASLCGINWGPISQGRPTEEAWVRHGQIGAFSPLAYIGLSDTETLPWGYSEKALSAVKKALQLRLRLLPYLYSAYADYYRKGIPPFRAMLLEGGNLSEDASTDEGVTLDAQLLETQYMMGANILVAPYYEKGRKRQVYFPPGQWYDFYSGKLISESQETIRVSGGQTPLYVKGGALIPMISGSIHSTSEAYGKELEIRIYGEPSEQTELWIYEDAGKRFDYLKGDTRYRILSFDKELVMQERIKGEGQALYGGVKEVVRMGE